MGDKAPEKKPAAAKAVFLKGVKFTKKPDAVPPPQHAQQDLTAEAAVPFAGEKGPSIFSRPAPKPLVVAAAPAAAAAAPAAVDKQKELLLKHLTAFYKEKGASDEEIATSVQRFIEKYGDGVWEKMKTKLPDVRANLERHEAAWKQERDAPAAAPPPAPVKAKRAKIVRAGPKELTEEEKKAILIKHLSAFYKALEATNEEVSTKVPKLIEKYGEGVWEKMKSKLSDKIPQIQKHELDYLREINPVTAAAAAAAPPVPAVEANLPEERPAPRFLKKKLRDVDPEMTALQGKIESTIKESPYKDDGRKPYVPEYSKAFRKFINAEFATYKLPTPLDSRINPDACKIAGAADVQVYKYQAFIRDYMRQAAPYRGVLVYHGLGSGKTCTSIAAAEALYSQSNKKIFVFTPKALKENFLDQLTFCGFRHYRLKNVWTAFPIKDETTRLFAQSVVGIPKWHMDLLLKKPIEQRVVWMPDLNQPESASNFETLQPWQQSSIRAQIYAVIGSKISFIGYTGAKGMDMLLKARDKPDFYDNSVIIIDEVHNLSRLMAAKLDPYLKAPGPYGTNLYDDYPLEEIVEKPEWDATTKNRFRRQMQVYEPVTVDRWVPRYGRGEIKYMRAYLFYRLFVGARNCKIIALSGTPIVNKPVELGILANMLHGYYKTFKAEITSRDPSAKVAIINRILEGNHRVGFYKIIVKSGHHYVFCSILEDGYVNVYKKGTKERVGVIFDDADVKPESIQELYAQIKAELVEPGVTLGEPFYKAYPVLPPVETHFNRLFISESGSDIQNQYIFANRISGLISYYKGSKEELMPRVVRDDIVECPMSLLQMKQYMEARTLEIEIDKDKRKKKINPLDLDDKESSSYRFRSRSVSNLAFPVDLARPFPASLKELQKVIELTQETYGDGFDLGEAREEVAALEADRAAGEEEDDAADEAADEDAAERRKEVEDDLRSMAEEDESLKPGEAPGRVLDYPERLARALQVLYSRKDRIFRLDPSAPEDQQLKTYSIKFAAILERMNAAPGSSLVYSTFKTVEGIDVFGYALEANGFARIQLGGDEFDREFDAKTIQSFKENPRQMRYILYSGSDSIRDRQIYINLFNNRISKLPPKIQKVIKETMYDERTSLIQTDNRKGEICRAFMITGAGAEGLSLRNVRMVHIMEPYWNKVRTDQVKGRAVRICSHQDLPMDQRTVEIFTYIAIYPTGATINETVALADGSITSDDFILGIGMKKEGLANGFINTAKAAAVDCQLNKADNDRDIKCYVYEGTVSQFLYDPELRSDVEEGAQEMKVEEAAPHRFTDIKRIKYKGVRHLMALDKTTGKTFVYPRSNPESDEVRMSNIEEGRPVAEVIKGPDGKMEIIEMA